MQPMYAISYLTGACGSFLAHCIQLCDSRIFKEVVDPLTPDGTAHNNRYNIIHVNANSANSLLLDPHMTRPIIKYHDFHDCAEVEFENSSGYVTELLNRIEVFPTKEVYIDITGYEYWVFANVYTKVPDNLGLTGKFNEKIKHWSDMSSFDSRAECMSYLIDNHLDSLFCKFNQNNLHVANAHGQKIVHISEILFQIVDVITELIPSEYLINIDQLQEMHRNYIQSQHIIGIDERIKHPIGDIFSAKDTCENLLLYGSRMSYLRKKFGEMFSWSLI
jgi:hypothetical protein